MGATTMGNASDKAEGAAPRIGLVLGAGGITGFAYHSSVLSTLSSITGWDPRTAEVIIGTSAGSGFGAMLRGGVEVGDVLAHLLAGPSNPETMARLRVISGRERSGQNWLWFGPASPRLLIKEMLRPWQARPSRVSLALIPNGRIPTEFVGDRARALHGIDWPSQTYLACAVRLADGERVVFGHDGPRTDVGTAVEASSAIPGFFRPVRIGGDRFVDGAVHSPTNADLIQAYDLDLVIVVSPMSGRCSAALRSLDAVQRINSANSLRSELRQLGTDGQQVLVIEPTLDDIRTMGPINMDPTRMVPTALQAGTSAAEILNAADNRPALDLLRRAAARVTSPEPVPYPVEPSPRTT